MPSLLHTRTGHGVPPFVFVHGFACARSDWDNQVAHLSGRHETVAVDLGGHGLSPGGAEHTRIETHGADVALLMDELQLPPSILVGHSMGCRVVIEAARRAPGRAKALILVDGSRLGEAGSRSYEGRARALAELGYEKAARSAFGQMFGADYDKAKASAIVERAVARRPEIAGPLFADIGRYDSHEYDGAMAVVRHLPVLAIQSTETLATGTRLSLRQGQTTPYLEMLRARFPDLTIRLVPGIGHFPQLERPAETNALIDDFLGRLR